MSFKQRKYLLPGFTTVAVSIDKVPFASFGNSFLDSSLQFGEKRSRDFSLSAVISPLIKHVLAYSFIEATFQATFHIKLLHRKVIYSRTTEGTPI